jgi:phosphoribosylformylglycinamidine synthase
VLEVQDRFTIPIEELRRVHTGTMPAHFGDVIGQ